MSWEIAFSEPRELPPQGYDASVWEWRLRNPTTEADARTLVFISGTAMATADESLPSVVVRAKATQGRAAVEEFLDWAVPPRKIELGTTTERPRASGGLRATGAVDERLVQELTAWFSDRDIDLELERRDDQWFAIMLRRGVRVGSADYGIGPTPAEAAQDAKTRFEAANQKPLTSRPIP